MPIFELGTGTNGTATNTVDSYYGPWSTPWAMGTKKAFSVTQKDGIRTYADGTQITVTANHVYVPSLSMRISSESTPLATGRGRIWSSGGTHLYNSASVNIRQDSATPLGNMTFSMGNAMLDPGTTYRFGFYISSGTSNSRVNYDWKTVTGGDIDVDTDSSASGDFTVNTNLKADAELMLDVEYYTFPDAPTLTEGTGTTSSIAFTINAPASTTYSGSITGYVVQYKESTSSTWITDNSGAVAGNYTIGGLTPGKSYNVRVAATNSATEAYVAKNSITTDYITGPFVSSTYTVKTFGKRMTDSSGGNSALTTIKRFVGIGEPGADSNGFIDITTAKRFDGTSWVDIG